MNKKKTPSKTRNTKAVSPIKIPRATADSQPANRRMLKLVEAGLKEDIKQVRTEIKQVRIEVEKVRVDFDAKLEREIGDLKKICIKTQILVEEQNANNRIVLEGLQAVWQRQEQLESR